MGAMPVAVGGKGIELFGSDGKRYIDASGGAAVSCLGHGHPELVRALHSQLDKLAYAHTSFFTTEVAEKLADRLVADTPDGLNHVYLVSGGSEAVEAALKMARQYFVETGEPQRRHIIARWRPAGTNGAALNSRRSLSRPITSIRVSPTVTSTPEKMTPITQRGRLSPSKTRFLNSVQIL